MGDKQAPPPGWYVERGTSETRWWDGEEWTDHTPAPLADSPPAPAPRTAMPPPPAASGAAGPTASAVFTARSPLVGPRPANSFGGSIYDYYARYAGFTGRSSRAEYWWAWLYMTLVGTAIALVDLALTGGVLTLLWLLGHIVPGLAIVARRLRDANFQWWTIFIALLVPFAGLVMFLQPSTNARVPSNA